MLKRRKHKMEFKDCQSGRKGLALVEKERDATQVAISNGLTDCEFYIGRKLTIVEISSAYQRLANAS